MLINWNRFLIGTKVSTAWTPLSFFTEPIYAIVSPLRSQLGHDGMVATLTSFSKDIMVDQYICIYSALTLGNKQDSFGKQDFPN